jgi:FkbM family methyltransferase
MLIGFDEINKILVSKNITINGVLHIGAHDCEELHFYHRLGLKSEDVVWIDAIPYKVEQARERGIPNVYNAIISDTDDQEVVLNITNNIQSSSILELGTHLYEHPSVVCIDTLQSKSITVDTFFERNGIDYTKYDFWNFDIQGAELMALKGSINAIKYAKALYLEVNEKELYKNCALIGDIDIFLGQYNFKRVLTTITQHGWGDALYIINN